MKVLVFGGSGKMGSAVAWDLAKNSKVGEVGIIGITGRRENALEKTKKWRAWIRHYNPRFLAYRF